MKNFFRAALILPLVLFAVSCSESNDDGGNGGNEGGGNTPTNIELTGETPTQQTVYADDEQAPAPIKFTAAAPWTATVAEVPTKAEAGRLDWLKLSKYEGGAGEVSIAMTLEVNTSGQDRKAEIRIVCGGTVITITVEQKGTTEQGEVPEDPDKPEPKPIIELTGETQQTVWADDQLAPAPIRFTALASWTATVTEVQTKAEGGSEVDWLALSAYSGEAGEVSLTAALLPNYTGKDRKAEIRIACGGTTVVITIEQKATKADGSPLEDPDKPQQPTSKNRIARIEKYWYNETGGLAPLDEYYEFTYDGSGRVTNVKWFEYGDEYSSDTEDNTTITYGDKTVAYESVGKEGADTWTSTGSIELNEHGWAVSGKMVEDSGSGDGTKDCYPYSYTYDEAGRLIGSVLKEPVKDHPDRVYDFQLTWTNGNPTQVKQWEDKIEIFIDTAEYGEVANNANIDLNWLLLDTNAWTYAPGDSIFAVLGYCGTRSKQLAVHVVSKYPHNGEYLVGDDCTYRFEIDKDGRVTKIMGDHVEFRITYVD